MISLVDDLHRAGVGDVRFDHAHRILYSTDASIYQVEPIGVVIPRTVEELIATVTVCAQQGVPVLPRGAGTSLAGQTVGRAVVVDTSKHLDRIVQIDPEAGWVRCQPGVVLDHLNAALRPHGLMLGPDPASGSRATVGGTVGNNGTGAHSILYGMIADNVLAIEAILADGSNGHVRRCVLRAPSRCCRPDRRAAPPYPGRIRRRHPPRLSPPLAPCQRLQPRQAARGRTSQPRPAHRRLRGHTCVYDRGQTQGRAQASTHSAGHRPLR